MSENTIAIYCVNTNKSIDVCVGATLLEIVEILELTGPNRPMNAKVNNVVRGLNYRCWTPVDVEFMGYDSPSGKRTYVRSLAFLLAKAVYELYPSGKLYIEHSISKGYYCVLKHVGEVTEEMVKDIKTRMEMYVKADSVLKERIVRLDVALHLLRKVGANDRSVLYETAGIPYVHFCEMEGYINCFYGCLLPRTSFITLFDLISYKEGLLIRVPQVNKRNELEPVVKQDKLFEAYKRNLSLLRSLHMDNVADLNWANQNGQTKSLVLISEAMQEKYISQIAIEVAKRYETGVRVVLISGPSSSGKTSFRNRLEIQLRTNLLDTMGISLDDYFVNRSQTPIDENGKKDYESLYALDLLQFNKDLKKILAGEEVKLPSYNFTSGVREYKGHTVRLKPHTILVIEGIHGLNPELTSLIPAEAKFKLYVSALTTISLDNHNWIPTSDNRLLRRIVRDYRTRGNSAKMTLDRWPSVRRGEDRWIFPYQEEADMTFNSAMLYELAALRPVVEPLLRTVLPTDKAYSEAHRLLRFLNYFVTISSDMLPKTSLIREFVGGGAFLD